ncbi:hypothetical protein FAES_4044 [Fibrella aestuarina BUZ 2]|uniref:Uncharacterized protein n=1 Tax=Fibrella aestuarina BUZ 2 TaxID=1166018 RepID=I0KD41_9BACT|nr:hypothetical protein FAES_4044 [Fibrella aestuarina BUZ 2]
MLQQFATHFCCLTQVRQTYPIPASGCRITRVILDTIADQLGGRSQACAVSRFHTFFASRALAP